MALSADYRNVEGFDSLTDDEAVTRDALVWATMAVGINEITEKNARDFYARVSMWEKVVGAYRFTGSGDAIYLTPEDVLRFVGLKTNASTLTKAPFTKHVFEVHERFNVPRSI